LRKAVNIVAKFSDEKSANVEIFMTLIYSTSMTFGTNIYVIISMSI
jgi:hypothetical protein